MTTPRDPDPVEPTLLPGSPTAPPASVSEVPADTASHPAAHDETVAPPFAPVAPAAPTPEPRVSASSLTEADGARAPVSGMTGATGATAASEIDATVVPVTVRTGISEKIGQKANGRTVAGDAGPAPSPAATGTMVGRFALKGLHARGGLGEVFTARDTELNREVAVKRIQSKYADDAGSRRRFLSEAEITARLDHPGVVPVFGLVTDGLGRPCYAMRFIRGETLKDEIDRYHGLHKADKDQKTEQSGPGSVPDLNVAAARKAADDQPRSVAFRHLLQRFIAVCQAIGYAHTRKVIHRDIKPANVMVGAFGETLVVDWGLAKGLDDGPDPVKLLKTIAEANFKHDPEATEMPSHMTTAGTAVGTPAYMAPEQASGKLELVGTAADVYSLGATLFCILAGKAPFSGGTHETLEKVRKGEFPLPREMNPDAPPPLEAVCLKAMSLDPLDRYATAQELSLDVERWLSDEPVSCYQDPLLARLARWARRHPARVAAAVSLLLAGVLGAAAVAWAVNEGRKNTQAALEKVTEEERRTADALKQVREAEQATLKALSDVIVEKNNTATQRDAAQTARDVAGQRYELAVKAFNTLVTDIQKQLADRAGTQEFRANLLKQAQKGLNELVKGAGAERIGADRTLVAAHKQMGDVHLILGQTTEARAEYAKAAGMAADVLKARPNDLDAERDLGRVLIALADVHLQAGDTAAARKECERALDLLKDVLKARPTDREAAEDVAAAEDKLADILMDRGETAAAIERVENGLKVRRPLADTAKDDPGAKRRLADSLDRYARALLRASRPDDALKAAAESVKVRTGVWQGQMSQPDFCRELAASLAGLGDIHLDRGSLPDARKSYEAAARELGGLLAIDPKNAGAKAALGAAHRSLSLVALRTGDLAAALKSADAANFVGAELVATDPESARAKRELAESREQLGDVLLARGKVKEALDAYRASVDALVPLEGADAGSARAKFDLARARERLGAGLLAGGKPADAVGELLASVKLREEVRAVDKENARGKREHAAGLVKLSEAHRADKSPVPAANAAGDAVTLLREVVTKDAKNVPARRELAGADGQWGELLVALNKPTAGLTAAGKSLDLFRALAAEDKESLSARADAAAAHERLAALYAELGQTSAAKSAAHTALNMRVAIAKDAGGTKTAKRELADAHTRVADTFTAVLEFDPARAAYKTARALVEPDPDDAKATAAAKRAEDGLALMEAVALVARDPVSGADGVREDLRVPALRIALGAMERGSRWVAAAEVASRLAAAVSASTADRYFAARVLARCTSDDRLTESARAGYAADAVKALEAAVKAGFADGGALDDSDWDPCRKLPAFQKVQAALAAKKK